MKKILSLFLCFIVAISAVGCNENSETSDNTNNNSSSTAGTSDTTSSENNSEESASGTVEIFRRTYDIDETKDLYFDFLILESLPVFREAVKTEESAQQTFDDVIEAIKKLKNLEAICFRSGDKYMKYIDLSFLEELPNLKVLSLTYANLSDYEIIGKLTNLEMLDVSTFGSDYNADLTPLANLTKLKEIGLPYMKDFDGESWLKENLPNCKMVNYGVSYKFENVVVYD